jgi:hypothetical protein
MGLPQRKFTLEFRLDAIERLETGVLVVAVAARWRGRWK